MIIRRRLWPMLIALLLFVLTIVWMGPLTQQVVSRYWLKPGVTHTIGGSQSSVSYQGTILQKKALESSDIFPIYGSSEFSAVSKFHPTYLFDRKPTGFTPFLVGRGGTQDIIHALNMAALGNSLKDKKIAVILSAQWFTAEGISPVYFKQNFSPLHAYRMLFNKDMQKDTKTQLIERLLAFPQAVTEEPTLHALLAQVLVPDQATSFQSVRLGVKGRLEMAALEVQDALKTIAFTQEINQNSVVRNATITAPALSSWQELKNEAASEGKAATQNNKLGIQDAYYSQYVQPKLAENRGAAAEATLYPSPEYQDLELLLRILQDEKAKVLFVIVPVNGAWYDYLEFPVQERQAYYAKVEKMVKSKNFQVANFGGHEDTPYFLQDVMHLGWKGWVYVDEALDRFYHEGA